MIQIECEQGSPEWFKSRIGLISASNFNAVMTEARSKADKEAGLLSETANSYMCELVAAIVTGQSPEIKAAALEWGKENEPLARLEYEILFGMDVIETGITVHDNRKIGASPDGFVGDDGMIEIKCPWNSTNHIKTVIAGEMPRDHIPQVQGNLWINGREWCDFISFDPRLPGDFAGRLFVVRIMRDNDYIKKLERQVLAFSEMLDSVLLDSFGIEWTGVKNPQED